MNAQHHDTVDELYRLYCAEPNARMARRIHAVWLAGRGRTCSQIMDVSGAGLLARSRYSFLNGLLNIKVVTDVHLIDTKAANSLHLCQHSANSHPKCNGSTPEHFRWSPVVAAAGGARNRHVHAQMLHAE